MTLKRNYRTNNRTVRKHYNHNMRNIKNEYTYSAPKCTNINSILPKRYLVLYNNDGDFKIKDLKTRPVEDETIVKVITYHTGKQRKSRLKRLVSIINNYKGCDSNAKQFN